MYKLQQPKLKMEPLLLPVIQFVKGPQHHLQKAGEVFFAEEGRGACRSGSLIWRKLDKLSGFSSQAGHQAIAQVADKLPRQLRRTVSRIQEAIDFLNYRCAAVRMDGFQKTFKNSIRNRSHQLADSGLR